jgi:hypothetical protein
MTDGPRTIDEEQLCEALLVVFKEYAPVCGEHRTHDMFKGMTAAFGRRLRGKRGKTDPARYSQDPRAVEKRQQRDWFGRLIDRALEDIRGDGGH